MVGLGAYLVTHLGRHDKPIVITAATKLLDCAERGDTGCLAKQEDPAEIANGMSRVKLDYLYSNVIVPFWSRQHLYGTTTQEFTGQGIAVARYRLENGVPISRVISDVQDEKGNPRWTASSDLLATFAAESSETSGATESFQAHLTAMIAGIKRHRAALEAHGINGITDTAGMSPVYLKWDKVLANLEHSKQLIEAGRVRIQEPATDAVSL